MILASRIPNLKNICGIAIDLSAVPAPSYSESNQPFYDSYLLESAAQSVYFGKRSVRFEESAKESRAGLSWETKVSITFPGTDKDRAKRIEEFRKAKYVIVQLNNGLTFLIGRNDFFQNTKPKVEIKSNEQLVNVIYTVETMAPSGFLPDYNSGLLPHDVPVNLLNAN